MLRNLRAGSFVPLFLTDSLPQTLSHLQIQMIAILNAFDPGQHLITESFCDDEPSSQDAGNRSVLRTSDSESQPARRKGEMLGRVFGRPLNR